MKFTWGFGITSWWISEDALTSNEDLIKPNNTLKKKVKLSRYMPWRHMGGEEIQLLLILNLGTRWVWVVSITSRPRFTPEERTPGTHWIGGWVGLRAGLDAEARIKILCPCRGSNPDHPARSHTILPELPRLLHIPKHAIIFTLLWDSTTLIRLFLDLWMGFK
jgi:hypothetical protein